MEEAEEKEEGWKKEKEEGGKEEKGEEKEEGGKKEESSLTHTIFVLLWPKELAQQFRTVSLGKK